MNTKDAYKTINHLKVLSSGMAVGSLVLGLCLIAPPLKAQNDANQAPPPDQQGTVQSPDNVPPGNPPQQRQNYPPPPQEQGQANPGPGGNQGQPGPGQYGPGLNGPGQYGPDQYGPPQGNQQGANNQAPNNPPPPPPATLTIPAGEAIQIRVNQWLSSDKNQPGDHFSGTLEQPVIANGWVVARRGQSVTGQVTVAQKSSKGGVSQLGVELNQITLVNGQAVTAKTEMEKGAPRPTSPGRDVNIVGTTTGVGAVVGGIAAGGAGVAIGAGLGATAGLIGVLSTRGNPTIIYPESVITFQLDNPIQVSTAGSEVAFQPISQDDYGQQRGGPGQPQLVRRPPVPYPYPYAAPYAYYGAPYPYYGYYYPGPAFGVYVGPGYYYRGRYFRR